MFSKKRQILLTIIIVVATISALLSVIASATTEKLLDGKIEVTDTLNTLSNSSGTLTATATGGVINRKTNTITVTNQTESMAVISFDYSVDKSYSFTIDDNTEQTSGTYTKIVPAKGSFKINITSNRGFSNLTVTLTMKNFGLIEVMEESDIEMLYDSELGSVTKGTESIATGTIIENLSALQETTFSASVLGSGTNFLGWIDADSHLLLEKSTEYTHKQTKDIEIQAVFVNEESTAWFLVDNSYLYDNLKDAADHTGATRIVLMNSGTLPAGDYTIPASATLLIPYDSDLTLCTTKPSKSITQSTSGDSAKAWVKPTVYRKLTMDTGANIIVNGAISLSGTQCSQQRNNGMPTGATSMIDMKEGSTITIKDEAFLYAWGYIIGDGSVVVESGGVVYEDFQLRDWRGGTAASTVIGKSSTYKVFPVTQYFVQNIEVPMTMMAGAEEYAHFSLVARVLLTSSYLEATVPFIGSSGMFQITDGYLIKDYIETEDRQQIDIHGDLEMSALNMSISSYNMNSANYVLPITNNLRVNVQSGTSTISQDMAFLPGSELYIMEGAKVQLATRTVNNKTYKTNIYVYDLDQWGTQNYVYPDCDFAQLNYVASTQDGTPVTRTLTDAKIVVNGTFDVSAGYLFTTEGGSNICSEGNGVVITAATSATTTYQYVQTGDSWAKIAANPAWLKNADGSFVETASTDSSVTYGYDGAKWYASTMPVYSTSKREGNGIEIDVQYRLEDYVWLNAICYLGATDSAVAKATSGTLTARYFDSNGNEIVNSFNIKDKVYTDNENGVQIVYANGVVYLVKKITAAEITDGVSIILTYENGDEKYISAPVYAHLLKLKGTIAAPNPDDYTGGADGDDYKKAYADYQNTLALIDSMLEYGEAAKLYFDTTDENGKPVAPDSKLTLSMDDKYTVFGMLVGAQTSSEALALKTSGVNVLFEERLSLMLGFQLTGSYTSGDISQIGVLIREAGTHTTESPCTPMTIDPTTFEKAMILYGKANENVPSGNVPTLPEGVEYKTDYKSVLTWDALQTSMKKNGGRMVLYMDLKSVEYTSAFEFRPFVITTKGEILYGQQVAYSLADYINNMYGKQDSALQSSIGTSKNVDAFRNLLVCTWDYALKADAKFNQSQGENE